MVEATMTARREGKKLVIEVPLTPETQAPYSSTGKSKILFTSKGFQDADGCRVSVTVINAK